MRLILVIVAALCLALGLYGWTQCSSSKKGETGAVKSSGQVETASSLQVTDMSEGTGEVAKAGKRVTIHYTGSLSDGTKFDSSHDRNEPFPFKLGAGEVVRGLDQGVLGMKVGGKRKLVIPPNLGYGERGNGVLIPPNSTLVFDVELLKVE